MPLPNFICVGAEKAGTTPLSLILGQHRDIFIPRQKETRFFTVLHPIQTLVLYETHFYNGYLDEKAVGELTPDYMRFPEVPGRLREALGPDLKLIFCLRDPLARAFSHYLQCVRIMEENDSFENAVALEPARQASNRHMGVRRAYLGGSLYAAQVARFLEHFPRENMFFMVLEEDFGAERARTMARLFDFLGVGPDPAINLNVRDTSLPAPTVRFVGEGDKIHFKVPRRGVDLPPGAILFTTGNKPGDRVIPRPSAATAEFFRTLQARMTRQLPEAFGEELYRRHFHDEIGRVEELLGRDLAVWRR
jgi:hypothetical protein